MLKNVLKKNKNRNYNSVYPKLVAVSFLALILAGTFLLMLPISVKSGNVSFTDALFTATSASCVTGLIVFDTFSKWTLFGQIVILCMIQIGGLGFITIMTVISGFLRKHMSIKQKIMFKESVGSIYTGDLKKLAKTVAGGTVLFELVGAVILFSQFSQTMKLKEAIYTSVFLSVSAFCNAGFDVLGRIEPGSSLITVNSNPVIILTISALIIIGGIGFLVWDDISEKKSFKKLSFHTKLTLSTTTILLIAGSVIYLIFEWNNTLNTMNIGDKLLNGFFASVTPRTAGFNSIPVGEMTDASKTLTYILMLIGGSPASTAGGIKTVTIAILFLCIISAIKNKKEVNCFGKSIPDDLVRKATAIFFINFTTIFVTSFIIFAIQSDLNYTDILFECFSALGTVGMTTGITPHLHMLPKLLIALLMYIGRLTSLSFVFAFSFKNNSSSIQSPKGNLLVG